MMALVGPLARFAAVAAIVFMLVLAVALAWHPAGTATQPAQPQHTGIR